MARSKELRRQSKDSLAGVVRKHFNGLGVQENEIIVDFLHKIRSDGVAKSHKVRRYGNLPQIAER
jgi:histone deacetylase complex subunit SAP30